VLAEHGAGTGQERVQCNLLAPPGGGVFVERIIIRVEVGARNSPDFEDDQIQQLIRAKVWTPRYVPLTARGT